MNILAKYILSPLIIMMSIQTFVCHASLSKLSELFEFSRLARQMSEQARLFVDPTYEVSNPESFYYTIMNERLKAEHPRCLIHSLVNTHLQLCEINRKNKNIAYTVFSPNDLNLFFIQAEESLMDLRDSDELQAQSELMINTIKTLKTMEPELFEYCFKFLYMRMLSENIKVDESFFIAYDLYPLNR